MYAFPVWQRIRPKRFPGSQLCALQDTRQYIIDVYTDVYLGARRAHEYFNYYSPRNTDVRIRQKRLPQTRASNRGMSKYILYTLYDVPIYT